MTDRIIRAMDQSGHFRFFAADTRRIAEEARQIHRASPTAAAAMGRILTMAIFLSLDLKSLGDSLTILFKGDGPGGQLLAVTDKPCTARISCQHPELDLPDRSPGHLDVGGFVGRQGTLTLIRKSALSKEPFSGTTRLVSGEIAEDFAAYFFQSEQIPTIVSLGVLMGTSGTVEQSGGLFVQALPGASEEGLDQLEMVLEKIRPITEYLHDGLSPREILEKAFPTFPMTFFEEKEPAYFCPCSKERMLRAIRSLPLNDRQELDEEDGGAEVICEFCQKKYWIKGEDFYDPQKEGPILEEKD